MRVVGTLPADGRSLLPDGGHRRWRRAKPRHGVRDRVIPGARFADFRHDVVMQQQPLSGTAPEDAGATTAGRYRFQYCCAGARLLAAIAEGKACVVICEHHEDYLVLANDGSMQAVSVKHREDHLASWSIPSLAGADGNLGHLLDTFQRANGQIDSCFESNRAHRVGGLFSVDPAVGGLLRDELAAKLSVTRAEVDAFVARLTIPPPMPNRRDIESTFATRYAVGALDALGIILSPSVAISIARDLIADASAERLEVEVESAVLAAAPADRSAVVAEAVLAARRVTDQDLAEALRAAATARTPSLSASATGAGEETTMTRKLVTGGLGPSTVETAQRRRRYWFSHVAEYRDIPHRQQELASLAEWVQDQANAAESAALDSGRDPYGRFMHHSLIERLSDRDALPPGTPPDDTDPALLSGAAYQLTDDCSIWFSPRPDPLAT
jgi:hypothetical protein